MTTRTTVAREVVSGGLSALPSFNTRVTLTPYSSASRTADHTDPGPRPDAGVEAASRVEDLRLVMTGRRPGPAELVLARPTFPGDLHAETPGAEYLVRWLTDRGIHEVVVKYLGRERLGATLLGWRLRVVSPVSRIQRRAHARVTLAVPIELAILEDAQDDESSSQPGITVLAGLTVNLSEGGVLATVEQSASPRVGAAVMARFALSGERFVLSGRVVRVEPVTATRTPASGVLGVAVQFDSPDTHGDRLRPLLFARQLRARRVGVS